MRAWRTPWANTLRITGLIFIHDAAWSKLSQISGYVGVCGTAWLAEAGAPGRYSSRQIISSARGSWASTSAGGSGGRQAGTASTVTAGEA